MKKIIPTKDDVEKMEIAGSYHYFNERLQQRYGIDVTIDEYMQLCRAHIDKIRNQPHKIIGVMKIKGVNVLVVRERHRKRKLLTALPFKNYNK